MVEKRVKEKTKEKIINMGWWITGIFFLMGILNLFEDFPHGVLTSIISAITGLIAIPPMHKKIKMNHPTRIIVVIVLMFLVGLSALNK